MSPDARLLCGLTLILAPGIVYRGLTVLGVVTNGKFGTPGPQNLLPSQVSLYRAGHAHAGALTLLSLFLQVALDFALLPHGVVMPIRLAALAAALLISGGFFVIAHVPSMRGLECISLPKAVALFRLRVRNVKPA